MSDEDIGVATNVQSGFFTGVSNSLNRLLTIINRIMVYIGALSLSIIFISIVTDTILRVVFRSGLPGAIDLVQVLLPIVFFGGISLVQLKEEHIVVDILVNKFSPVVQAIITTNGYLLSLSVVIILAWQLFIQTSFLFSRGSVSPVLRIPEWITVLVLSLFICVFALAIINSLILAVNKLFSMKTNIYLALVPGIIASAAFIGLTLKPDLLPFRVIPSIWGGIAFSIMILLIFLKIPISLSMGIMALIGFSHLSGSVGSLANLSTSIVRGASSYVWAVMPLFTLMGELIFTTGLAQDLYSTCHKWVGHLPGGLASATVAATTVLSAMVGNPSAGIVTVGTVALPEMRKYKYDMSLGTASIASASTIGILIPPSTGFVVYGMITEISITKLFMAGIIPGILLSIIFIALITILCTLDPSKGPRSRVFSWRERFASLKDISLAGSVILITIGGLYLGLFTPTEGGAIGAFLVCVAGLILRRLKFKGFIDSIKGTLILSTTIMTILILATSFAQFISLSRLPVTMANYISGLGLSPYLLIIVVLILYLFLGCILNAIPGMILTLPVIYPIVVKAGFDPIWFGVIMIIMIQVGNITPPVGMNIFAMSALVKDVPMAKIIRGIFPFLLGFLVIIVLLILFPQIALFIPNRM